MLPGVNELFSSPERADGHQKWVDFVTTFWHCECISRVSEKAFTERYQKWCKHMGYNFSAAKASDIYIESLGHIVTLPRNNNTKLLIQTAAWQAISIHAPRGGSDSSSDIPMLDQFHFNPRSPWGERRG